MTDVNRMKFMLFDFKRSSFDFKFKLDGVVTGNVDKFKIIGCVWHSSLLEGPDMMRLVVNFNKSVGMFMRKFNSLGVSVKIPLLES